MFRLKGCDKNLATKYFEAFDGLIKRKNFTNWLIKTRFKTTSRWPYPKMPVIHWLDFLEKQSLAHIVSLDRAFEKWK